MVLEPDFQKPMCLVVWNQTLWVADQNKAQHSEKGIASGEARKAWASHGRAFAWGGLETGAGEMGEAEPKPKLFWD